MVGAGEDRGVAFVIAANFHAAMPAGVQKDVDAAVPVSGENDRLFTHTRRDVVARLGNSFLTSTRDVIASCDIIAAFLLQFLTPQSQQRLPYMEHVRGVAAHDLFLILARQ